MVFLEAGEGAFPGSCLPWNLSGLHNKQFSNTFQQQLSQFFFLTVVVLVFPIKQHLLNFEQFEVTFVNKMEKKGNIDCALAHILPAFVLEIFVLCFHKGENEGKN